MPAATTSGFQVQAVPGIAYRDPRTMVPEYSQLLPQIRQGLATYGDFQQIADQAKARPILEQLRQIQLNKAGQPIDSVIGTGIEEVNRYPMIQSQDDDGNPIMEQPAGSDTFQTEAVEVFDPVSGLKRIETRRAKPLQTMEQGMYQQAQIEGMGALADQRGNMGEAALLRAENNMRKIQQGKRLGQGINPRTNTIVFTIQNPDGSIEQIDSGNIAPPSQLDKTLAALGMGQIVPPTPQGVTNIAQPSAPARPAQEPMFKLNIPKANGATEASAPAMDEETQALIDRAIQSFAPPAAAPVASSPAAFNTLDEAQAAANSRLIKKGQKITVGGQTGTWK